MSIQGLLPKVREHRFPESRRRRHILTIVLVKIMFIMWRRSKFFVLFQSSGNFKRSFPNILLPAVTIHFEYT